MQETQEQILIPSFTTGEPNLISARRKNDQGICAKHECQNKLDPTSPYHFIFGVKLCQECGKIQEETRIKLEKQSFDDFVNDVNNMVW